MIQKDLLKRALTDSETGLPNHRFFELEQERVSARSGRYRFPVGIITIDCRSCDGDTFQQFARLVSENVRRADCLARTGATELRILITHRDTEEAPTLVDRLHAMAEGFADQEFSIDVRWTVDPDPLPA